MTGDLRNGAPANKIHPSDDNSRGNEDDIDDDLDNRESDVENLKEESVSPSQEGLDKQDGEPVEEESRDQNFRMMIEKFFFHSLFGEIFQNAIGVISVITSIAFVILSYTDWSRYDSGCIAWYEGEKGYDEWYKGMKNSGMEEVDIAIAALELQDDNNPKCLEFYYSRMPPEYELVDQACALIYLFYYFINLFISPNRCQFFISAASIMELLIIIPPLWFNYQCSQVGLTMKALSRMIRIYKVDVFLKSQETGEESNVSQKIKMIALEMVIMFYMSAVMFMVLENLEPITNFDNYPYRIELTLYVMVVTLTTVGYGDYYPQTTLGKILIMFMILYIIVYKIPVHTQNLLKLLGLKSFYAREFYVSNNEIPHVVITGQVVIQALTNFSDELFHPDHGTQDKHAIILQPHDPSNEMEMFLHNPKNEHQIWFINGNPMVSKSLERADVSNAKTCILLTNKNSKDAVGMDHKNILIGLAMKKYVYDMTGDSNMQFCMQLIKPESKQHYLSSVNVQGSNDQIIIVEEIKMNLMSKSCFSPGIINFVSNLISSIGDQGDMDSTWLMQYAEGMGHEIYRIKLSEKMENKTFGEISGLVYKQNKTIVFAIEIKTNGKTIIRLNPSDFMVNNINDNQIYVYTICPDEKTADEIETLEMTKEEINKYYNAKAIAEKSAKEEEEEGYEDGDTRESEDKRNNDQNLNYSMMDLTMNDEGFDELYQQETEDKKLMQDYYVWDNPASSMSVTLASLENDPLVKNHIVVCGIHSAIKSFIMPLRAKYLKEYQLQRIVIITGEPDERGGDQIDSQIWNSISRFKFIYLVNGSPLKQETLLKANINYADKVVILGHDSTLNSEISDEMLDAESIYIYQAVKKVNKDVQILTELVYSSNIEFLLPFYPPNNDYHLSTLYAAGEVYISAIIDTLTCQSYFNPHIVTILQQILKGASEEDDEQLKDMMKAHPDLTQSNLWQIPVPETCVGKDFDYLFNTLLKKKLICMALYRLRGATDNEYPYVYTNPESTTIISHRDRVFVLGIDIPDDLQGDIYEMVEKDKEVELGNGEQTHVMQSAVSQHKGRNPGSSTLAVRKNRSVNPNPAKGDHSLDENERGALKIRDDTAGDDQEEVFLGLRPSKNQSTQVQMIAKKLEQSVVQIETSIEKIAGNIDNQSQVVKETTRQITLEYLNSYKEDFQERINKEKNI